MVLVNLDNGYLGSGDSIPGYYYYLAESTESFLCNLCY